MLAPCAWAGPRAPGREGGQGWDEHRGMQGAVYQSHKVAGACLQWINLIGINHAWCFYLCPGSVGGGIKQLD